MNIIGLCGPAGSGKSLACNYILEFKPRAKVVSLAEPIKTFVGTVFDLSDQQLYGPSDCRNEVDQRYGTSPRELLQSLGTDWGRAKFKNVWINVALRRAHQMLTSPNILPVNAHTAIQSHAIDRTDIIIIPDVRFINEIEAIKDHGGVVWKLMRQSSLSGKLAKHPSERELNSKKANSLIDVRIENHSTKDNLRNRIKTLLDTFVVKLNHAEDK